MEPELAMTLGNDSAPVHPTEEPALAGRPQRQATSLQGQESTANALLE